MHDTSLSESNFYAASLGLDKVLGSFNNLPFSQSSDLGFFPLPWLFICTKH